MKKLLRTPTHQPISIKVNEPRDVSGDFRLIKNTGSFALRAYDVGNLLAFIPL